MHMTICNLSPSSRDFYPDSCTSIVTESKCSYTHHRGDRRIYHVHLGCKNLTEKQYYNILMQSFQAESSRFKLGLSFVAIAEYRHLWMMMTWKFYEFTPEQSDFFPHGHNSDSMLQSSTFIICRPSWTVITVRAHAFADMFRLSTKGPWHVHMKYFADETPKFKQL